MRLDLFSETFEEKAGHLFCGGVDQPAAELRKFAADLRGHIIVEDGVIAVLFQPHNGASLGEARDSALAFACDAIAVRRIEVRQCDSALKLGGDGADLDQRRCGHLGIGCFD